MKDKSKKLDFSLFNILECLQNIYSVFLLVCGTVLFDSLSIMVYKSGVLDMDFSEFLDLSKIPFLLLFLVTFGIITTRLSCYAETTMYFLSSLIPSKLEEIVELIFAAKPKDDVNSKSIDSLYEIAVITENEFLMEYVNEGLKAEKRIQKMCHIIYSLLIVLILNLIITLNYEVITILKFVYNLYMNNNSMLIKIFTSLLLIPIVLIIASVIKYSIIRDENIIYYPDVKYKKLVEKMKLLLKQK